VKTAPKTYTEKKEPTPSLLQSRISTRLAPISKHRPRPPSLPSPIPALWMPPSNHASSSSSPFPVSLLQQLVQKIVPELSPPGPGQEPKHPEDEEDRLERLDELVTYCSEILGA